MVPTYDASDRQSDSMAVLLLCHGRSNGNGMCSHPTVIHRAWTCFREITSVPYIPSPLTIYSSSVVRKGGESRCDGYENL